MKNIEIWTEKYRPKLLDDFISNDKERLAKLIDAKTLPHLLLVSKSPGTGKTTLAKIIIDMLGADALFLNSSDDRKIEVVRDKINKFASSLSSKDGIPRIVFMDEFDGTTGITQDALRNVMETFYNNCRFILTANNESKVIDPIKSRCFRVDLRNAEKSNIVEKLRNISKAEGVKYENDEVLAKIVDIHYPNIRDCIKTLQMLSMKGAIKLTDVKPELHVENEIYAMLKVKNFAGARKTWLDQGLNAEDLLLNIYRLAIKDNTITEELKKKIIVASAKYNFQLNFGDPEVQLSAYALNLIEIFEGK